MCGTSRKRARIRNAQFAVTLAEISSMTEMHPEAVRAVKVDGGWGTSIGSSGRTATRA